MQHDGKHVGTPGSRFEASQMRDATRCPVQCDDLGTTNYDCSGSARAGTRACRALKHGSRATDVRA